MTKKTLKRKQEEKVEKENEPKKRMSDEPAVKKVYKYLIYLRKLNLLHAFLFCIIRIIYININIIFCNNICTLSFLLIHTFTKIYMLTDIEFFQVSFPMFYFLTS